jgi:hypothetical protein
LVGFNTLALMLEDLQGSIHIRSIPCGGCLFRNKQFTTLNRSFYF